MKILIVRNDKLGDFVLSLPVFSLLKQYLPNCELHAFVPAYTSELANYCEWIDKVIIDPGSSASWSEQIKTLKILRAGSYDAVVTLFTSTRTGVFMAFSGIKYRLAPATKFAQIFYNKKLTQRRSKSLKPEYVYNLDLAVKLLADNEFDVEELPKPPYIYFEDDEINNLREVFFKENNITLNNKLIFIHPGTGGSATNLNLHQYAELAKNLDFGNTYTFVITAGPGEIKYANQLSQLLNEIPHVVYSSSQGLLHFCKIINLCEIFISASTGPLHIAGALNRKTAAFYQRRRSATPLRWQTLNSEGRRLAFVPPEDAHESDLNKVDVVAAAEEINKKFIRPQ